MASQTWIPSTYTTGFTNLGSLGPTSFPSDCLLSLWDFQTSVLQGDAYTYVTQGCAVSSCCPSGRFYTEGWAYMTSYFSPGVCPSQYRSCSPPPPTAPTVLSTQPGETVVFCCPTNYACPYTVPPGGQPYFVFCQSLLTLPATSVVVMDDIFDQSTVSTRSWVLPTTLNGVYNLVYPIQIRMGGSSATSTPANTTVASNSHSVLPVGAIAGVAIGAFFAGMLVLAGAVLVVYRRRWRHRPPVRHGQVHGNEGWVVEHKPELDGRKLTSMAQQVPMAAELNADGSRVAELPPHGM